MLRKGHVRTQREGSLSTSGGETSPTDVLNFRPPQCEKINLSFKPPTLVLVMAALANEYRPITCLIGPASKFYFPSAGLCETSYLLMLNADTLPTPLL